MDKSRETNNLILVGRLLLCVLRLLMKLLLLGIRRLGIRLWLWWGRCLLLWGRRLLLRRRATAIVAPILLRGARGISLTVLSRRAPTTTVTLLRKQYSTNAFVNRFEGRQIRGRDLDGIASHRQHHNVLPGVKLILVLHHLGSLPVVLNPGTLQGKLFDLHRDGTTSLRFNYGNIVFGLKNEIW